MIKHCICLLCAGISLHIMAAAQGVAALRINDRLPDTMLGRILNEPGKIIRTSDFKGKLIILDFWNVHCSSCIASMHKMDSLQQQYQNSIQIIYVTTDSDEEINRLFSKIKIKRPDVPFITEDTLLKRYFPHNGDPYHVWIDQGGKIYALTFDYCTNIQSVGSFLNGIDPQLIRRWDFGIDENYPLVSEQNAVLLTQASYYSLFFKSLIEYSNFCSLQIEQDSLTKSFFFLQVINAPLIMLYSIAFDFELYGYDINYFNLKRNNRICIETKDSSIFFPPLQDSLLQNWSMKHTYSYEARLRMQSKNDFYKHLQQDLDMYLPYTAVIEKRKVNCLVLKRNAPNDDATASYHAIKPKIIYNDDGTIEIQNMPTDMFVANLIYANPGIKTPIIDASDFTGCLNMKLKSKLSDIEDLRHELENYGFSISEENMEIEVLVIKDKKDKR